MAFVTQPQSVEEFHGPYGAYHVSELVLQRIWFKRAFDDSRLVDSFGRRVVVESPGEWNRLEGPDFKGAMLIVDGLRVVGDVEIHFSQSDWRVHGHDGDPRYDGVVLHVVYHPVVDVGKSAINTKGVAIAAVSMMERLWYSLEEYACEDSIVAATGVDLQPAVEGLLVIPVEERRSRLIDAARKRWALKCHFASLRLARLGWTGACHQTALEILGYARNRIPMLILAERHSIGAMPCLSVEELWDEVGEKWRLSGCRPANHPKMRLRQYLNLLEVAPAWPDSLLSLGSDILAALPSMASGEGELGSIGFRRVLKIPRLKRRVDSGVFGGEIAGSKADTLVCDGFLPLAVAKMGGDAFQLWFHWFAGNGPASCDEALRLAGILEPRRIPMSNGWLQGILGLKE